MSAVALQSFGFGDQLVRTLDRDDGIWFVANDVCGALEIANPRNVVAKLDDDEKGVHTMDTLGGRQELTIVSESGVYALIFKSRKPVAVTFRKWVTGEVLPTLRDQGRYEMTAKASAPIVAMPEISERAEADDYSGALAVIREARLLFGKPAARRMWPMLGLPEVSNRKFSAEPGDPSIPVHDSVRQWMAERTRPREGASVRSGVLWEDYQRWAERLPESERAGLPSFGRSLTGLGVPFHKSGPIWRKNIELID